MSLMPDTRTLDIALKANNLPVYGTKAMKWARLNSGGKSKKKSELKTDSPSKLNVSNKAQISSLAAKTFAPSAASKIPLVRLDRALVDKERKSMGLTFVKLETAGAKPMFVYTHEKGASDKKTAVTEEVAKSKTAVLKRKREKEDDDVKEEDDDKDDDDDDDDDDEDDDDLDWACEVSKQRLLKKCQKQMLKALCAEFGVSTSGSKEQLADLLSEQLHAETDDEADEDEE